jgi:integrase
LYQNVAGGVWMVRRRVPEDVRARIGKHEFVASTGTFDSRQAERRRDDLWREWDTAIAEARALGSHDPVALEQVTAALDRWKRDECRFILAGRASQSMRRGVPGHYFDARMTPEVYDAWYESFRARTLIETGTAHKSLDDTHADAYFEDNPTASRSIDTPLETAVLISRLEAASLSPEEWRSLPHFDEQMHAAMVAGGLSGTLPAVLRARARPDFAAAWAAVVQHQELVRLRAAFTLAAREMRSRSADAIVRTPDRSQRPSGEGSGKTVAQAIEDLRVLHAAKGGAPEDWKRYSHAYRTMIELFGSERRLSTVRPEDALAAVALLRRVPASATKKFPGLSLAEAADAGEKAGAKAIAPNTLSNVVHRMGSVFTNAGLPNPFKGLAGAGKAEVRRRAFTIGELTRLFDGLRAERSADDAFFWVSALALFQGARQNEMAQLQVGDIKRHGDLPYIDLTVFDSKGVRSKTKRLKNQVSERVIPVHPAIVEAGFLNLVERRCAEGAVQLFPELQYRTDSGYARDLSRWFSRFRKRLGIDDPGAVFHSFRHSWSDAARRADLPERITDALGGWSPRGQAARYGNVHDLPVNLGHLTRIEFGAFVLPAARSEVTKGRGGASATV